MSWEGSGDRQKRLEAGQEHVKREGEMEGEKGSEKEGAEKEGAESKREEGANSPFYRESGIPGCCQITVGWNLDKMLTLYIKIKGGDRGGEERDIQTSWKLVHNLFRANLFVWASLRDFPFGSVLTSFTLAEWERTWRCSHREIGETPLH